LFFGSFDPVGIGLKRSKQILNSPFVKILLAIFLLLFAWKLEVADRLMFPDSVKTREIPGSFIAFSPSGQLFITTRSVVSKNTEQNHAQTRSPAIEIRRVSDGKIAQTLENVSASTITISPDDSLLAAVVNDRKQIQIWRISDGRLLHSLEGVIDPNSPKLFLAFTNDSQTLLSQVSKGSLAYTTKEPLSTQVSIWNVINGEKRYTLSGEYWDAAISPDGKLLAIKVRYKSLELYRLSDGTMLRQFDNIVHTRNHLKFSLDGKLMALVSGVANSSQEGVYIYSVQNGTLISLLSASTSRGHYEERELLNDFAFSPDSSYVAASYGINSPPGFFSFPSLFGGEEKLATHGRIRFWSLKDGQPMQTLRGHRKGTNQLAFSSDGKLLATVSGSEMRFWRMPPRNYSWLWLWSAAVVGIVYFGRMYLRYLIRSLQP
jgi:WD40 repeat protein